MLNILVNLGPSLHFCNKIWKDIKSFFLNFKTNTTLLADNQMTKIQSHAGQSLGSSWQLIWDTMPRSLPMKEPQRDSSPKRKTCPQLFLILGIKTVQTFLAPYSNKDIPCEDLFHSQP